MLFDTHLHIVDRTSLNYPWLEAAGSLNRDNLYEDYAREALRCGITGALHMEVDVAPADIGAETAYVKQQAARPASLVRGAIASCRPEESGFEAYLEKALEDPFIQGFRRVLHVVDDTVSEGERFRRNIARLAGTRLTFDLCMLPRQLDRAVILLDHNPGVRFILDHCGVPAIRDEAWTPWSERIVEIAKRPNVTAKISGVIAYADPDRWSVDMLRPYIEHVIDNFGWDRVVWGSDWPVCTLGGGLSTWVAATHALTSGCSADERDQLYQRNAKRIWQL